MVFGSVLTWRILGYAPVGGGFLGVLDRAVWKFRGSKSWKAIPLCLMEPFGENRTATLLKAWSDRRWS